MKCALRPAAKLALCAFLLAWLGPSATPGAAAGQRTLALADFVVRVPSGRVEESVWLGPAISELLQAKMQLFGGARVLERQRVGALLLAAGEAGASVDDPAVISGIVPAEVLVAGSVSIDPKDPRRIRVQARAFEVETAKIVSEAGFSGTGDLAGLLKLAEDLAKTLADGLRLAYTPEKLAYAEPTNLFTLQLFVEGAGHLAAGRHREAIASFQKALEGNGGRYFAAAHRWQGEAYQELAKAAAGDQERAVREEYLRKFKQDALAASGALHDLGLAYEANLMWTEAIGAYRDYIDAVGAEGERVLWRIDTAGLLEPGFPAGAQGERHPNVGRVVLEGEEKIHFVASRGYSLQGKAHVTPPVLVTLDARTGEVARRLPLSGLLGAAGQEQPGAGGVIGQAGGRVVVWGNSGVRHVVVAVGPTGEVLWRHDLGEIAYWSETESKLIGKGLVACRYNDLSSMFLDALDVESGALRSRIVLPATGSAAARPWDLDPVAARLRVPEGSHSLEDGSFTPRVGSAGAAVAEPREDSRETGIPGLTYTSGERGTRFFRDGAEAAFVEHYQEPWPGVFPISPGDPILLNWLSKYRFVSVDSRTLALTHLYRDYANLVRLEALGPELLLFRLDPVRGRQDPRYDLPLAGPGTVYNILEAATGEVAAKFTWPPGTWRMQFLGRDLLFHWREFVRLRVPTRRDIIVTPLPEVRLRIAHCLFAHGDAAGAEQEVAAIDGVLPGDPRVGLLRLRLALRRGAAAEAAGHALRALGSGALGEEEVAEALASVRAVRPEVRDALRVPVRTNLLFCGLADDGALVARPAGSIDTHLVVDALRRSSTVHRTPELLKNPSLLDPWPAIVCRGRHLFGFTSQSASTEAAARPPDAGLTVVERIDLHSGLRAAGSPFPRGCRPAGFLPGIGIVVQLSCETEGGGLWRVDPENLVSDLVTATTGRLFLGPETAVVVAPPGLSAGKAPYAALDRSSGALLREGEVPLRDERIVDAAADREGLVFAIAGGNVSASGEAKSWVRISSVPLRTGGPLWEYTADGVLGGNVVIEGGRVSFPAFEGDLPAERVVDDGGAPVHRIAPGSLPLRRVSLDRAGGARLSAEELPLHPWNLSSGPRPLAASVRRTPELTELWRFREAFRPPGPRRILPGSAESIVAPVEAANFPLVEYWLPAPGRHPLGVEPGPPGSLGKVLVRFSDRSGGWVESGAMLAAGDTVYESLGGGVLLVKDLAGGAGLDRLLGPHVENDRLDAGARHP